MTKLRPADVAAGVAGVALLVVLFLPWYEPRGVPAVAGWTAYAPLSGRLTAWQSLSVVDILVALAALAAIAIVVVTATASGPAKPVASAVLATVAAGIALLLVLWRALDPPQGYLVRCYGVWVALGLAALMFAASWAALHDERTPGAVPPDIPRRPPPPA
jgi:hypothetical protein